MLCTLCSREVKPVVAVDIDGTLGDYHLHFINFAEEYLGRSLPRTYSGVGEFRDSLGLTIELYRELKLAYRQGGKKRSMPIFDGAAGFVHSLSALGVEVYLTTTRPWQRLDNVDPDTRAWLDRHGIRYDGLLYDRHKYRVLSEIVHAPRVVMVLDDLVEQLASAEDRFGHVGVKMNTCWNVNAPWYTTEDDYASVLALVESRIYRWRESNGCA